MTAEEVFLDMDIDAEEEVVVRIPKSMASSRFTLLPEEGSVKTPLWSSMNPPFRASSNLIEEFSSIGDPLTNRLTFCVTVAVVTVMLSRLLSCAAPIGVISSRCSATSIGTVLVVWRSIRRPELGSILPSETASSRVSSPLDLEAAGMPMGRFSMSSSSGCIRPFSAASANPSFCPLFFSKILRELLSMAPPASASLKLMKSPVA